MRLKRATEERIALKDWVKKYSVREAANEMGVQRDTVYKAIENNRQITLYTVGKRITYAYEIKPAFKY